MQDGFREFIEAKKYTAGATTSRLGRIPTIESLIGMSLEAAVADDETMYKSLLTLKAEEKRTGSHGNLQHVVRQYYEYKNGRKFPQLREYEKLTGR